MDAHEGQVPSPRRALPRLRRPAAPAEAPYVAPDEHAPRVADLSALIADIDALRLTLQTDLTLAAAALEAGAEGLAGELVDSDLGEVRAFGARAADRLTHLETGADEPEDLPSEGAPPLRRRRRRRILSAAPLMAAAAALVGFVAVVPERGSPAPATTISSAVLAGYELNRLAQSGATDEELRLAAEELNAELARLIALADDDPAAAQQALMLLETSTAVLSSQGDSDVLRGVMAETRALRERLRRALPVVAARPTRPQRIVDQPEKERSSSPEPTATPTAAPSSNPTAAAAPASPAPAPTPASEPSPAPSQDSPLLRQTDSDNPFLQPGTVAGW